MQSKLANIIRLLHIVEAIEEIESYILNNDFISFMENSMMRFACVKQMEIIGEAANHISEDLKSKFSTVEWSQITGMRNVFVHEYFGIDSAIVWEIIKKDIPELKSKIALILTSFT